MNMRTGTIDDFVVGGRLRKRCIALANGSSPRFHVGTRTLFRLV
jgi:hypothetical protein